MIGIAVAHRSVCSRPTKRLLESLILMEKVIRQLSHHITRHGLDGPGFESR